MFGEKGRLTPADLLGKEVTPFIGPGWTPGGGYVPGKKKKSGFEASRISMLCSCSGLAKDRKLGQNKEALLL